MDMKIALRLHTQVFRTC